MGLFVLASDITIGKFRFSGVHEVRIRRSLHSVIDTATITIPSISKIVTNGKVSADSVITGKQFTDGDPVVVKLGYNNNLQTEFMGFVKRRSLDMPLSVECEGYSWLMRRNNTNEFYKSITAKELLEAALTGIETNYSIAIECTTDLVLNNVAVANKNGLELLNILAKSTDGALVCFFKKPDTLWCGSVYTSYAEGADPVGGNLVQYRLGYNLVKDNSLKERISENDPVRVIYHKKLQNGTIISGMSDVFSDYVRTESKVLNHINDAGVLNILANEKAYQLNYTGYEGALEAFLQPFCQPGDKAYVTDDRYPERNGTYLVEGTDVRFGVNGARRTVEIGPLLQGA